MSVKILQCPLFNICRASMARVCTCEMPANELSGGATIVNPRLHLNGWTSAVQVQISTVLEKS